MAQSKPRGSAKARRTAARLAAVQALYQIAITKRPAAEVVAEFVEFRIGHKVDGATFVPADITTLTAIVQGARAGRAEIAGLANKAMKKPLEHDKLELLLQAILDAGIWELARNTDLPAAIIIAEYVDVARGFYGGTEPGMINGVLDRVARDLRANEMGTPQATEVAEDAG